MQDPFEKLPTELRLAIFESLEDFDSLASFLDASTFAASTFVDRPGDALRAVATRLPKELQQIIRAVAVALCDATIRSSLEENEIYINHESSYEPSNDREDKIAELSFSGIPLPALAQLLKLACRIQRMTSSFLQTYITRFDAVQPSHLADSSFMYRYDALTSCPAGVPYVAMKKGRASWVEEYRVARALWRLQLRCIFENEHDDLLGIEEDGFGPQLPNSILQKLQHTAMWPPLTKWELDQVACVEDYVNSELGISLHDVDQLHAIPMQSQINTKTALATSSTSSLPAGPPTTPLARFWQQDRLAAKSLQEGYHFFHSYGLRHPRSPLQVSNWVHFRRLGFGMWDGERLCKAEFTGLPMGWKEVLGEDVEFGMEMSLSNISFTWKSIEDEDTPKAKE